jgi:hypothetical protein
MDIQLSGTYSLARMNRHCSIVRSEYSHSRRNACRRNSKTCQIKLNSLLEGRKLRPRNSTRLKIRWGSITALQNGEYFEKGGIVLWQLAAHRGEKIAEPGPWFLAHHKNRNKPSAEIMATPIPSKILCPSLFTCC